MFALLKFLVITFLVIYILSRFAGYVFRFLFWIMGKKVQKEFKKQERKNQAKQNHYQQTGEYQDFDTMEKNDVVISIPTKKRRRNPNAFDDEDYVDFEEVK